jgi:peroxiredoxin
MFNRIKKSFLIIAGMITLACTASIHAQTQAHAVDFSFRAIDGQPVTAESVRGEVVVLVFGASWLPLTRNQMEAVKKLADEYAGRGVAVYWVSTESDSAKSKNFASDDQLRELAHKYKVGILRDPDGVAAKRMGVDQLPSVLIINKLGNITEAIGGMDPNANLGKELASRLEKVL